jgi:hypothetical protein
VPRDAPAETDFDVVRMRTEDKEIDSFHATIMSEVERPGRRLPDSRQRGDSAKCGIRGDQRTLQRHGSGRDQAIAALPNGVQRFRFEHDIGRQVGRNEMRYRKNAK